MKNAAEIKRVYDMISGKGEWVKMTTIAEHLDLAPADFSDAVLHLMDADPDFEICPEINQKSLTSMDRLYRVPFASCLNDMMIWI